VTSIDFLKRIPLFHHLSQAELGGFQAIFQEREYKKNQVIFIEEETGKYMYIVKYGEVKVLQTTSDGRENILAIHGPGDTFGELSLLDNETTPATVVAMEDCKIISISKQHFESVLMKNPKVVEALLAILCRKLRDSWKTIQILKFNDAETRLKHVLVSLARVDGIWEADEALIHAKITHQDLAEMAGTSRETISRIISKLQAQNLLKIRAHKFVLTGADRWKNV
jgi:CRP-like cAMP-binding protein